MDHDKYYDLEEFPEIIDSKDNYETMKIMRNYYGTEFNDNTLSKLRENNPTKKIDNKLFSLIHPKIKKIIEEVDA